MLLSPRKLLLAVPIALLPLVGCGEDEPLTMSDKRFVCRATIATVMGRSIHSVEEFEFQGDIISVQYTRSSDDTLWQYACKIEKDRVIWANIENGTIGRWRDSGDDERLSFRTTESKIKILQTFVDGSTTYEEFYRSSN